MHLIEHRAGGYRFLTGIAPYSSGVVALPGCAVERVQFAAPRPYREGLSRCAEYLAALGRPVTALCAVELRIPKPLTFAGFADLNASYRSLLAEYGLLVQDLNPIARTNVAPAASTLDEPVLFAFSHTVPVESLPQIPSFVVAGAGDLRDQADLSPDAIVRPGEATPDALLEKAQVVMDVMEARLVGLGMGWSAVGDINIYTTHAPAGYFEVAVAPRIAEATLQGVHWYCSHPPIAGLAYEMDLRRVTRTSILE